MIWYWIVSTIALLDLVLPFYNWQGAEKNFENVSLFFVKQSHLKRISEASHSFNWGFWRCHSSRGSNSSKICKHESCQTLILHFYCLKKTNLKAVKWKLVAMVNSNGGNISYKTRLFCSSLLSDKRSRLYFIWCQMGDLWWHYMPSGGRGRGIFCFREGEEILWEKIFLN